MLLCVPTMIFSQGDYLEEAKVLFEKAVEANKAGNDGQALLMYNEVVKLEPSYAEAYVNMSSIKYKQKDYSSSLDLAKEAYAIEKVQYTILSQLGKSYYMNSNYDSAAFFLERIKVFQSLNNTENYYLAASKVKLNDFVGAKDISDVLVSDSSKNSEYLALKGNVNYGLGEYEQALNNYQKALELDPENIFIYSNIANTYLKLNNSEEALSYIEKGIETATGKNKVSFLVLKGNYFQSIGELDNAENAYNSAYEIDQSNSSILVNQAGVLIKKGDFQSAIEKCNTAITKNENLMEAYYNRGIANEMIRNTEEACSDWEQAFILGSEKAEEFLNSSTCNE